MTGVIPICNKGCKALGTLKAHSLLIPYQELYQALLVISFIIPQTTLTEAFDKGHTAGLF